MYQLLPKSFLQATDNLIKKLIAKGQDQDALDVCIQLSFLHAKDPAFWSLLAECFSLLKCYEASADAWQRVIDLNPDPRFYYYQSIAVLRTGDLKKGLELHEARIEPFLQPIPKGKLWRGEDIRGQNLVVYCHSGFGDSIQFLRYVPYLKQHCNVLLQLQPELQQIFRHLDVPMYSTLNWEETTMDRIIYHDSLPYCFKTDLANIPPPVPIQVPLCPLKGRIGIAWRTESENLCSDPCIHPSKSIHLRQFIPLFDCPDVQFVVAQKDISPDEAALLDQYGIERPKIETFADTLRILQECELVISCDTSTAHLAGSMGIATWVLLPYLTCWRWGKSQRDSPWYPSVKLFRNNKRSNLWHETIQEIKLKILHLYKKDKKYGPIYEST